MKYPQQRNIFGEALTRLGKVDQRKHNGRRSENNGNPYQTFKVEHHPLDMNLPWQVWATVVDTGEQRLISRHRQQHIAERNAERERIKQPDRRPSPKLKHRLGVHDT